MITLFLTLLFGNRTIEIINPPLVWATVTAYSSTISQTDDSPFLTASQKKVQEGFIACPRRLSFGTIVEIEGKEYVCEDRLALKFDDRYDIWMPNEQDAKEFGIKELPVLIK